MTYRLSIPAERDLAGIAQSTLERWGSAQCLRYGHLLENALQQLARLPTMGRPRDIDVARVLHQRMEVSGVTPPQ